MKYSEYKILRELHEQLGEYISFLELFDKDCIGDRDLEKLGDLDYRANELISHTEILVDLNELIKEQSESEEDVIIELSGTMKVIEDEEDDSYRICSVCGEQMTEGYCIEGGIKYYCSDECMESDGMTREEFLELYDDGEGDSYWTDWGE